MFLTEEGLVTSLSLLDLLLDTLPLEEPAREELANTEEEHSSPGLLFLSRDSTPTFCPLGRRANGEG